MIRTRSLVVGTACGGLLCAALGGRTRSARRRRRRAVGHARHLRGRLHGVWYRVCCRHPDEHVADLVLADRIRSTLGPLEHALDQPRIHVGVYRHVATLHGDVATEYAAQRLVDEVRSMSGVAGVQSHLHVGLMPGDACPSEGLER